MSRPFAFALLLAIPLACAGPEPVVGTRASVAADLQPRSAPAELLPQPAAALSIDPGERDFLAAALRELAASSGVGLVVPFDGQAALRDASDGLAEATEVAPDVAWSVVQSLLLENGLFLVLHRSEEPALVSVAGFAPGRVGGGLKQRAHWVEPDQLEVLEQHPALLVTTVVHLSSLDARQVTNSLRGMLTDIRSQSMLPVGSSRSIVLTGPAHHVLNQVRVIREAEAEAARAAAGEAEATKDE